MKPRICICCGEAMVAGKNALSRNPHVCASCSSLADGMEEADRQELLGHWPGQGSAPAVLPVGRREVLTGAAN